MRFSPTYSILRKELRALGGLWLAMIMLCAIIQMSLVTITEFNVTEIHHLTAAVFGAALILAAIYAAGSTGVLFAMEHEAGTFGLLRRLPISPQRIFFSKLLWPAVTVIAFWAVAWPLSRCFTTTFPSVSETHVLWALWGVGAVETFAWGTFFSLRSRRPLVAAFLGLALTGLGAYVATVAYINLFGNPSGTVGGAYTVAWPFRLLVACAVLALDVYLGLRWFDASKTLQTTGPDESAGTDKAAWGERWQARLFGKKATFFSLVWQHWRQSRGLVGCLAAAFVPLVIATCSPPGAEREFWTGIGVLLAMATFPVGASLLFMPDQRHRSYRFLSHHGASPSTVWWSRQSFGIIVASVGAVVFSFLMEAIAVEQPRDLMWIPFLLGAILSAYACGQFASLLVRSPVIAAVAGCAMTCVMLSWMVLAGAYLVPRWVYNWTSDGVYVGSREAGWDVLGNILRQHTAAFCLAVLPILIALVLASRFHVKDWLSDHVSRRSHLRWVGVLCISFVIVYACLPIMRFANAPADADPGFSVVEFERAQDDPRVKEGAKLFGELDREVWSPAVLPIDPDGPLATRLIEFGKDGPLPVGLRGDLYRDSLSFRERMELLYGRLEGDGRRLDAIALLRTWVVLAPATHFEKERSMECVFSRLYEISVRDDLSDEELQAAINLARELTPTFAQVSDGIKWEHVHLQESLGVPTEREKELRWPRQLVLALAPWEKTVYLRFLNDWSRSNLDRLREVEEGIKKPDYRPEDDYRDWGYGDHITPYAAFGNPAQWWGFSSWRDAMLIEQIRRPVLLCLLIRKWQMEHEGELPESLESLVGETSPELLVDLRNDRPYTLNRKGRPFSFEVSWTGIRIDSVPADTPYITRAEDGVDSFVDMQGASGVDEESRPKQSLRGAAWPLWVPKK